MYKLDSLEQYGRRENLKIHSVPENKETIDNGVEIILKVAKCLNINFPSSNIQRAHRLGKKDLNQRNLSISIYSCILACWSYNLVDYKLNDDVWNVC